MITGPAANWLRAYREDLNGRFARAARRTSGLDGEAVLAMLARVLPGVAGDEPAAEQLCSAVFDLVLLHVSRGTSAKSGIPALLELTFPALRPALLQAPGSLPAQLSNAVENLADRGEDFAVGLGALALELPTPAHVLDAGALLAWRLGKAALREEALAAADRLSPVAVLGALAVPAEAPVDQHAARVIEGLRQDAWLRPGTRPAQGWQTVARVGDFAGFGGQFSRPPQVLEGGSRHVVYAKDAERRWRIDADCFGWMATPDTHDGAVKVPLARGFFGGYSADGLYNDGVVRFGGLNAQVAAEPAGQGAVELGAPTSWSLAEGRLATASPDSHRITIAVTRV